MIAAKARNIYESRMMSGWKIFPAFLVAWAIFPGGSFCPAADAQGPFYQQTDLVSDIPGYALHTDAHLVNPWGLAHSPSGPWWVSDNRAGIATMYSGEGEPLPENTPLVVTIPPPAETMAQATPTGIVFNGTRDFEVARGMPARMIFVTEDGTISAWSPAGNPRNAVLKVDNSQKGTGSVYKGAAIAFSHGLLHLYVTNFRNGSVDVFNSDFGAIGLRGGAFTDPEIPDGFAPFNIMNIDGKLLVTFARQDSAKRDDVVGAGNGYADLFTAEGKLILRLSHGPWLNSPWGIALAPEKFGEFSKHILLGNYGSGQIACFDPDNGAYKGMLKGKNGQPITINGLWGLAFGNWGGAGPGNTLFFSAGINDKRDGLVGSLTAMDNDQR